MYLTASNERKTHYSAPELEKVSYTEPYNTRKHNSTKTDKSFTLINSFKDLEGKNIDISDIKLQLDS